MTHTQEPPPALALLDTAIVGAGIGGCFLAEQLARERESAGHPRGGRVALFERTHRVGGRLWTVRMGQGPDAPVADLGAMRLHRGLRRVLDAVARAGLTGDLVPFDFGRPENLVHVRGVTLRQRELTDPARIPYDLAEQERGLAPEDLVRRAADALVPGFTELRRTHHTAVEQGDAHRAARTAAAFRAHRDRAAVGGLPLWRTTYADALRAVLGAQAVALLHDTGGYDVATSGENAAEQLGLLFRTPPDAEYVTLRHGMQSLPLALCDRFTAAGGGLRLGHRLLRIDRAEPGAARTAAERGEPPPRYLLTFALEDPRGRATGEHLRVHARTVLLALPPGPLRRLAQDGLPFTPRLRADLAALDAVPAHKLFLLYETAWWRRLGLTRGRATTDLPLRQLWYGGTCPPPAAARGEGPALLLAAYPSGPATEAWHAVEPPHPSAREPDAAAVERAHRLVARMHGLPGLAAPLLARRQDWNRPPHDGAWHVWRPGHDPEAVAPRVRRPLPGEAVHLVSDCWTPDPGSIEGVVSCAEAVLSELARERGDHGGHRAR
ncbi:flavin monoamine oxidase family protein [Streptomyces spectabilis]|uniref:Monoamine oxidase n=1 Tax=Streptomyces spectabilis TaxID=68270 RepID=A0A7W8AWI2_STRST|nr:FAD-dependent oxidoreductase [Streptomyces spectabilis]MBB5105246.1 monoamine oxidase [Streptomyces spectabilis]MCI3906441.1 FAD-dependent oxidoreductase [Streptomyces spectabilis]